MSGAHHGHTPHLSLLPTDADGNAPLATHVAVNSGDWFNPGTWASGEVPGAGALVHIPEGVSIAYEGSSDAGLFIVRVDGALNFFADDGQSTKMVVDTIITAPGSSLVMAADADTAGDIDVVFTEGTPGAHASHFTTGTVGHGVLGRTSWDPEQLSLGLVAGGDVTIKGQDVESGLQLAESPMAGATELIFNSDGTDFGWEPGQLITVGGTEFLGRHPDGRMISEDEVREITDVRLEDGKMIVTLDAALEFDHPGKIDPTTDIEMTGYVGNMSRNVTFSSAAADNNGDGIPEDAYSIGQAIPESAHYVTERGHVMFMHNDDVSVLNTAFHGLGRTDKTREIDDFKIGGIHNHRLVNDQGVLGEYDPNTDFEIETPASLIQNMRGRYAVHIHEARKVDHDDHDDHSGHMGHGVIGPCPETGGSICHCGDQDNDGILDCDDDDYFEGAYLEGNAVWGSPGWGIVQHSSDAVLKDNVVVGVNGSAIVSESGDETGRWEGNLTLNTYGVGHHGPYEDSDDFNENEGAEGIGYYLKARAIEVIDNVAQSSARSGFFYHNNGVDFRDTPADALDFEGVGHGLEGIHTEDVPIRHFEGNEVIAAETGIRIATDPLDGTRKFNDAWSHFKDFKAWEIDEAGVSITYSSKYIFEDFLILGTEEKKSYMASLDTNGFFFKASVSDITVLNSHVENMGSTVYNWTQVGNRQEYRRGYWDPKAPSPYDKVPAYEGMGTVEGIENPAYNLWNTTLINVTADHLYKSFWRSHNMDVETSGNSVERMNAGARIRETPEILPEIEIELLGDSRDGGLVALWRENLANHSNMEGVLRHHIPLAYQESTYLSKVFISDTVQIKRKDFLDYEKNINADIWSGTALEFAKEDSLGRHVFLYEDFSPLQPSLISRAVTTNEKLLFTKDMIDGVLQTEGYVQVGGISDVKFVVMKMAFTDRVSGEIETKKFLVALDLAWQIPEGAKDNGLLLVTDDLIVAPQYRVFSNGALVGNRAPIVLTDDVPDDLAASGNFVTGAFSTDQSDDLRLGANQDFIEAGGGDDIVRGFAAADYLNGGAGNDQLFGGNGWDRLRGGEGDDLLDGHYQRDFLIGGAGNDLLQGGFGRDDLDGGEGDDTLNGGTGKDQLFGGAGADTLIGGNNQDTLDGGADDDQLFGGTGKDQLHGDDGNDLMFGGAGNDLLFGGAGQDTLDGGAKADQLFGGEGNDLLRGGTGMDELYGEDGSDALLGGAGRDLLFGGDQNDALSGDGGDDTLLGESGEDVLLGGSGNDRLTGGDGADRFVFENDSQDDVITDFEDGVDAIEFLIDSFGFDDLDILDEGDDAIVTHSGGTVRLIDVNASQLDASDFGFGLSSSSNEDLPAG